MIFNPLMQTVDDMVGALEMIEGNFLIKARLTTDGISHHHSLEGAHHVACRF